MSRSQTAYSQDELRERREKALQLVQKEGLPDIIARCRKGNDAEKEEAAAKLSFLAQHDTQCASTIVSIGGVPPLVEMMMMGEGRGDADGTFDMREQAVKTISDLCEGDKSNTRPIAERGAIPPLLKILEEPSSPWSIKEAASYALSLLAKEVAGGPAQEDITDNDGVNKLVACYKSTGCTPESKASIKQCLRQLTVYNPAKKQMMALGILKPRERDAASDDPFAGLD